ncbi:MULTISPECIES: ribose-phosphate pyrophosphokinase [unclassified Butyrivibrio]|uniref:ribose-phosphate pyrophosphokinase n=1 Tax=unclassified Butyrivibrio TaxID=2639466 RepID=UPI00041F70FD|nr:MULTISPECIES: ribose-phosphate pyrophosphokinase [unclassified Butyrivibrio]MCR5342179.1 ribose-phosphate pyrophosphokinase [Butyrivibrio sp.]
MPDFHKLDSSMPVAPIALIVMDSAKELGELVNSHLVSFRHDLHDTPGNDPAFQGYVKDDYRVKYSNPRFGSGESKAQMRESVRGKDVFILTDVMNHSMTYKMYGYDNYYSPDDHYQDLKRVIAAINGKARRINIIMPFLYEGRQHNKNSRESLDAAVMFSELYKMGIGNFITFDAHDPRISNAAPICGFDNFMASPQFMKALISEIDDLTVDKEHLTVISPDEGALDRAVYFANVLNVDTGMFYKRRDYSKVVNGSNPIVAHEYLGSSIDGKDVIIIDDMISSGSSMIDTSRQLKKKGAKRVFICTTFGLFTNGIEVFDEGYNNGDFDALITTNLIYQNPEFVKREYYHVADMSKFMATIIDFMNHDDSLSNVITPTDKLHKILEKYNSRTAKTEDLFD